MTHLLEDIKLDVNFVKSHSLQPKWYKALKVVILVGFLVGYGCLFGLSRTAVFCASFFSLSFLVHLLYRANAKGCAARTSSAGATRPASRSGPTPAYLRCWPPRSPGCPG